MISEERLRELEWAATYLKSHKLRRCRCAGSCPECKTYNDNKNKINAETVLDLIKHIKQITV